MKTITLFKIGAIFLYGNLSPVVLNLFNALMLIAIFGTLIYLILRKKNPEIHLSHTESIIPMATKKEISSSYELKISKEKKNELFKKLIQFEESKGFLEKNLTLTKVAHQLGTNTKYLSHIIKLHSDRDFNNYINLLRVQYIINQLDENPKLHQYKISALAEEAGFSSHSKFAHFFKLNIGLTPSKYIADLKELAT